MKQAFCAELWQAPPSYAEWHIAAALAGGLALDALLGWYGQLAADFWILTLFAWLLLKAGGIEKRALLACLAIATLGEAFLSLAWGLYDYQFRNIPVFVPPGHALLMTLGVLVARRMPAWAVWLVPMASLPYVMFGLWQGWDRAGAILYLVFLACLVSGKARLLYSTMFALSLLLELYGTWLGNWTWRPLVPWLELSNTNPPICSGAFYCVLDLLVLASMRMLIGDGGIKAVERNQDVHAIPMIHAGRLPPSIESKPGRANCFARTMVCLAVIRTNALLSVFQPSASRSGAPVRSED